MKGGQSSQKITKRARFEIDQEIEEIQSLDNNTLVETLRRRAAEQRLKFKNEMNESKTRPEIYVSKLLKRDSLLVKKHIGANNKIINYHNEYAEDISNQLKQAQRLNDDLNSQQGSSPLENEN